MSEPFVVVGCPIRNRAWALPRHLAALRAQAREPDAYFYLANDCDDHTRKVGNMPCDGTIACLHDASVDVNGVEPGPARLRFDILNTGDPGSERVATADSPRYSTANLAAVRNEWVRRCLEHWPQASHLWSCDSDVIPDPDVLEKLLAADVPVCAAVVRN